MNEKILGIVVLHILLFASCVSTKSTRDVKLVESNTRAVVRIEDAVGSLDTITRRSKERLDDVARRSGELEDGIGKLEFMFECYEREIERLWCEVDALRDKIAKAENGDFSWLSGVDFVNNHESVDYLFED